MTPDWAAATVRARGVARRRLGAERVRRLAAAGSLPAAVRLLENGPYGLEVTTAQPLRQAQHCVWAAQLWNVRVLAGWVPRDGVAALRALAGWLELVNLTTRLRTASGADELPVFRLGSLATGWPRLAQASTGEEARRVLAGSLWGDPRSEDVAEIELFLRAALARRVAVNVPDAAPWAEGAGALLLARQRYVLNEPLPEPTAAVLRRLCGPRSVDAPSLAELRRRLPPAARWVLVGVAAPGDLWRAEFGWWRRVEDDALQLLRAAPGPAVVVGTVALLAVDAWRVCAALEVASRDGRWLPVFDAEVRGAGASGAQRTTGGVADVMA